MTLLLSSLLFLFYETICTVENNTCYKFHICILAVLLKEMNLDIGDLQQHYNDGQLINVNFSMPPCALILVVHQTRAPSREEIERVGFSPCSSCQLSHSKEEFLFSNLHKITLWRNSRSAPRCQEKTRSSADYIIFNLHKAHTRCLFIYAP